MDFRGKGRLALGAACVSAIFLLASIMIIIWLASLDHVHVGTVSTVNSSPDTPEVALRTLTGGDKALADPPVLLTGDGAVAPNDWVVAYSPPDLADARIAGFHTFDLGWMATAKSFLGNGKSLPVVIWLVLAVAVFALSGEIAAVLSAALVAVAGAVLAWHGLIALHAFQILPPFGGSEPTMLVLGFLAGFVAGWFALPAVGEPLSRVAAAAAFYALSPVIAPALGLPVWAVNILTPLMLLLPVLFSMLVGSWLGVMAFSPASWWIILIVFLISFAAGLAMQVWRGMLQEQKPERTPAKHRKKRSSD